jgi:glycosyltransferase involved in cell wall biosynthesis
VSSSKAVGGELRGFFPDAAHKRRLVPYTVSMELCQRMANEYRAFEHTFDGLRLLSVGRLSKQKGFDLAVEIFERLQAKGYLLEWTIIGEGSERPRLEQMIAERKLEGFHLVGLKENPYPYFADCDIYVQPSRYEGYCITLAEARMFAKPSVVTDFAGAREQLKPDETGLIVDCAVSALEAAIQTLLDDPALRQKFSDNLRAENANQAGTTSAFTRFLEEETSSLPPQL